jgi:hypothetical protein
VLALTKRGTRFGAPKGNDLHLVGCATITPSMLDLCSAPCKARRFAPPAHARGLRALTVPARRSRLGHYVMVGSLMTLSWTDLDR